MWVMVDESTIILNQYYLFNGDQKKEFVYSDRKFSLGPINTHVMMSMQIVLLHFNIHVMVHFEMDKIPSMIVMHDFLVLIIDFE